MAKYRRGRINEALAQELSVALRDARDPGLAEAFISITRAEVAPDLRNAKVYFSHMGENDKEVLAALRRATPMFRRHLAETLNLRITPELTFAADHSIEHGARIHRLLAEIKEEEARRAADAAPAADADDAAEEEDSDA